MYLKLITTIASITQEASNKVWSQASAHASSAEEFNFKTGICLQVSCAWWKARWIEIGRVCRNCAAAGAGWPWTLPAHLRPPAVPHDSLPGHQISRSFGPRTHSETSTADCPHHYSQHAASTWLSLQFTSMSFLITPNSIMQIQHCCQL